MKNLNNERISKSIEKEEKIEQKNTLQQSEELKEQNKKDNSTQSRHHEKLSINNNSLCVKDQNTNINEQINDEYNFEIFKDNDDLFNSTADCLSSHSLMSHNNEFNRDFRGKSGTMKISNTLLMNNNSPFFNSNIERSDNKKLSKTRIHREDIKLSHKNNFGFNNNNVLFPVINQNNYLNQIDNLKYNIMNNNIIQNNIIQNNYIDINNLNFYNNFHKSFIPISYNNIFLNNQNNQNNNTNNSNNQHMLKSNFNKKINNSYYLDIYLSDLENLLKKDNCINLNIFKTIKSEIPFIITNQTGCRIMTKYLPSTPSQIIHLIYKEIEDKLVLLLQDSYANNFCVQLFCYLELNDRYTFLYIVSNNIMILSLNKIGTYPVQFIIGKLHSKKEKQMIIQIIKLNLLQLSLDIYGTHVIEKIIMTFEFEFIFEIFNFITENLIYLSNHPNGLCLVKKTLVLQYKKEFYQIIKQKLIDNAYELIENSYGNYALQIVIDNWMHDDIIEIFKQFFGRCSELSIMKFSSNVIERFIEKSQIFLNYFIQETCIEKKTIGMLIKNNYGNYVIQTALKYSKGKVKKILINSIENNLGVLGDKKLINKWKNIISSNIQNNIKDLNINNNKI